MITESARLGAFLAAIFAAAAILSAFLPLWLADRSVDPAQIGTVLGLASLVRVFGVPVCGWVSDRTGRHRAALAVAAATACLLHAALPATNSLVGIALLVIAGGIAASALPAIADAVTLALAAAERLDYGRTRAWGSTAYMLATAATGALLGRFGSDLVPWLIGLFYGVAALLAGLLPSAPPRPSRALALTGRLGPAFRRVLLASMLIQGSHAAYYAFGSLHWRQAGISDATIGLLIGEGIVAEILLFVWGRRLVEWLGPSRLTAIAAAACVVRWTALAFTVWVPALAVVQLLHAATFAFQHLSSMLVLRTLPAARAGLAQTMLAAFGFSAPTGVLMWVSGRIYGQAGGRVFLLMAAVGGLALLVAPSLPGAARRRSA